MKSLLLTKAAFILSNTFSKIQKYYYNVKQLVKLIYFCCIISIT